MKRDSVKNLRKVGAKAKEQVKVSMARQEEPGPQQPPVVTTKMVDRKNTKTFQVGRDIKTGRFITVKAAKRRTKTAVVETLTKKQ